MTLALVTGAARGLGRSMVNQMTMDGVHVIAVDIDCGPLKDQGNVTCVECDLTNPASDAKILAACHDKVDVLVHAAGISGTGPFQEIPWDRQGAIWALNFAAPVRLTQSLLKGEYVRTDAKLCFISSLSSFVGYPGAASYAGSKDGLTSYARSLSKAAIAQDMAVMVAFPGPLRTDHAARYAPDNSDASVERRMHPDAAAKIILSDLAKGKRTSLPGGMAKSMALLGRIAPGLTIKLMRKAVFEKMDGVRI